MCHTTFKIVFNDLPNHPVVSLYEYIFVILYATGIFFLNISYDMLTMN